jgi:hypothetical protein
MVIARTTRENIEYVPLADRQLPEAEQTTFLLAALPNHQMLQLLPMTADIRRLPEWITIALKAGLRGWRNFRREDGSEVEFRREDGRRKTIFGVEVMNPASDATLELLPTELCTELAQAILDANRVTVDDAKN